MVRVGGDSEDGGVECEEVFVVLTERMDLGWADEGEIERATQTQQNRQSIRRQVRHSRNEWASVHRWHRRSGTE